MTLPDFGDVLICYIMTKTKSILLLLLITACICTVVLLYFIPSGNVEKQKILGTNMPKIEIYTKSYCPYCVKAKELLKRKEVTFEEISIEHDHDLALKLVERSGGRKTVPQIFINDFHVGGCDDLYAMDSEGKLDKILK
jgi:glutaredoxin 3